MLRSLIRLMTVCLLLVSDCGKYSGNPALVERQPQVLKGRAARKAGRGSRGFVDGVLRAEHGNLVRGTGKGRKASPPYKPLNYPTKQIGMITVCKKCNTKVPRHKRYCEYG